VVDHEEDYFSLPARLRDLFRPILDPSIMLIGFANANQNRASWGEHSDVVGDANIINNAITCVMNATAQVRPPSKVAETDVATI
jgi:hypothetical protein